MRAYHNIWFTSDWHFGHTNIINFSNRPFTDTHHMNCILCDNHNKVVKPNDIVYHLGDIAMNPVQGAKNFNRLNGKFYLIRGNHDMKRWSKFMKTADTSKILDVWDLRCIKVDKIPIMICHYRMDSWDKSHFGSWHFFGHSHQKEAWPDKSILRINVGVDAWEYKPVNFEILRDLIWQKSKWTSPLLKRSETN
jgi:calcineurin-like phosphoesterase family protein